MYAVIASGGKQYRVAEGQTLKLEKLPQEAGKAVEFEKILMVADGDAIQLGSPFLTGVKVSGEVVSHGRHDKVRIIKFRRRKHHMKQMGHRQDYTAVKITLIDTGKPRAEKAKAETAAPKKATAKKPNVEE